MIWALVGAIAFTLGVSFICSLLEALILSTTVAEIEQLKKTQPRKGRKLEKLKEELPDTISAILTLNTIANTAGSVISGGLAARIFGDAILGVLTALLTVGILVFSEIIPKNLGVVYRVRLQPWVASPLALLKWILRPITYLAGLSVRLLMKEPDPEEETSDEEEIILLAEKGAKEGTLTSSESSIVTNALKLDDVLVSEIMTPRTVIEALEAAKTVSEVFEEQPNLPFARIPVYREDIDNIVGLARRRDLLTRKAEDEDETLVSEVMDEVYFIPETVTVAAALQTFLKHHQQLLVVSDEYGSLTGVVTMEDVMESIIGREIFEKDDVAIDMRELARHEGRKAAARAEKQNGSTIEEEPPAAAGA